MKNIVEYKKRKTEIMLKGGVALELNILLKKLREEKNLTVKELAEKAEINPSTISEIERGANKAKNPTLEKICKGLNLTQAEREKVFATLLPEDIGKRMIKGNLYLSSVKDIELMEIPLYSSVSAGLGCSIYEYPLDWVMVPKATGDVVAIKVKGDSMEDTIKDGAYVIVKKDVMVEIGEIGVFLTSGTEYPEGLVKRLRHKNGIYVLESDNPKYKDIELSKSEIVACGKVINIINNTQKIKKDPLSAEIEKLNENERTIIANMIKAFKKG